MTASYAIDQVLWHTNAPENAESREQSISLFYIVSNFLQKSGLTTHDISCQEADIGDWFGINSDDLTEEGMVIMKAAYDKWLTKVDNGMSPQDLTVFERALKKVRDA